MYSRLVTCTSSEYAVRVQAMLLHIEPEVNDIAVLHNAVLTFQQCVHFLLSCQNVIQSNGSSVVLVK